MKIHFLGTASGLPTARRFSQTIALEIDGELHILDVADGASSLFFRNGLDHGAVRSIVISHMHGDHHSGLIQFLKTAMHLGRKKPLLIYMPGEGIAPYRKILDACYLIPEWLGYEIEWRPIQAGEKLFVAPTLSIRPFANEHLQPFKAKAQAAKAAPSWWRYESYSFLLDCEKITLAYSGNLRKSLFEMEPFATGVDALVCELAHLDPEECRKALIAMRPRLAFFTHFGPRWDDGVVNALQDPIPGVGVYLAKDGDVYHLDSLLSRATSNESGTPA